MQGKWNPGVLDVKPKYEERDGEQQEEEVSKRLGGLSYLAGNNIKTGVQKPGILGFVTSKLLEDPGTTRKKGSLTLFGSQLHFSPTSHVLPHC